MDVPTPAHNSHSVLLAVARAHNTAANLPRGIVKSRPLRISTVRAPLRIDLRRPFTRIMGVGVFNFRLLLLRERLRLVWYSPDLLLSRFCYFVDMRRTESIAILAVLALSLLGCRA